MNVSDNRYDLGVKRQGQIYFESAVRLIMEALLFWWRVLIFSTMITYGKKMITQVSDRRSDQVTFKVKYT